MMFRHLKNLVACLRSVNTFGCILEIEDMCPRIFTVPSPRKRGTDVHLERRASQADSGLRIGPMSLPCRASATFAKGGF